MGPPGAGRPQPLEVCVHALDVNASSWRAPCHKTRAWGLAPKHARFQPRCLPLHVLAEAGPLFKAVDARERERELQQLRAELADWQHKAAAAAKEMKAMKGQHSRKE